MARASVANGHLRQREVTILCSADAKIAGLGRRPFALFDRAKSIGAKAAVGEPNLSLPVQVAQIAKRGMAKVTCRLGIRRLLRVVLNKIACAAVASGHPPICEPE